MNRGYVRGLVMGRLGDAFGIKGWLHLYSYSQPPHQFFNYKNPVVLKTQSPSDIFSPIEIVDHKTHGDHFVVQLKNCVDRDQALLFKHKDIYVDRDALPALPSNEFYWEDLIGLQVVDTQGKIVGVVDHLMETGSNDVIGVKTPKLHYIPYLPSVVIQVDLANKKIVVDWEFYS